MPSTMYIITLKESHNFKKGIGLPLVSTGRSSGIYNYTSQGYRKKQNPPEGGFCEKLYKSKF